jgi:lipoprotein NlpI
MLLASRKFICASALATGVMFCSADSGAQEVSAASTRLGDDAEPKSIQAKIAEINAEVKKRTEQQLAALPEIDGKDSGSVQLLSTRGDLLMFLGKFQEAERDFQQMVTLKPDLDAGHWRLGIANFFAGHPDRGAAQFEKYHSFDSVDRENGIWRYFCHYKSEGRDAAKKQLLRYEKDDRPPFREVYQLFEGTMTPEDVLRACEGEDGDGKDSLRFYSYLYVGLNASLEKRPSEAIRNLQLATLNPWPQKAGFGPEWMWHVGRLELNRLVEEQSAEKAPAKEAGSTEPVKPK